MRILQVNHGYPPRYAAGSEVYCRNLAQAQAARGHDVSVFAREEDPYRPDYDLRIERDGSVDVWLANMPRTQHRYQHDALDRAFAEILGQQRPHVVHIHHLNHLSVGLPTVAARTGAVTVCTVHDFWLVCPRGQLVQWSLGEGDPWALCGGQLDAQCARACYGRCHSGTVARDEADLAYWTGWVGDRMAAIEAQLPAIDRFVCPSRTVADALVARFPAVARRVVLRDYGFPERPRCERRPGPFTFGYIGTHAAPKGVDRLIHAFRTLSGLEARLKIWGRHRGQETEALRRLAAGDHRIEFVGEYSNDDVAEVLAQVDAIVVPSIWLENSPLVIHEAQQARICVVTADAGGMAEFVEHEVNGLLFRHRDSADLAAQMRRLLTEPELAKRLGARGYLGRADGHVPSIRDQIAWFDDLYASCRGRRAHVA